MLLAEESALWGTVYVATLVALQLAHVVLVEHWYYANSQNSANMRALLMMAVFRCGLHRDGKEQNSSQQQLHDAGHLTNLMATDADRIAGAHICLRLTNWTLNTLRLPYTA